MQLALEEQTQSEFCTNIIAMCSLVYETSTESLLGCFNHCFNLLVQDVEADINRRRIKALFSS